MTTSRSASAGRILLRMQNAFVLTEIFKILGNFTRDSAQRQDCHESYPDVGQFITVSRRSTLPHLACVGFQGKLMR
jgi:hypothetical protein